MYNLSTGRREPAVCPLILRTEPRMGLFRAQLIDEFFRLTDKIAGTKPAEEARQHGLSARSSNNQNCAHMFCPLHCMFLFHNQLAGNEHRRRNTFRLTACSFHIRGLYCRSSRFEDAHRRTALQLRPRSNARRGFFSGLCLPRWRFTLLQPFSEW